MSSWAERVHRRAADFGSVVTSCGHPGAGMGTTYPYRLEKVKFGVPLDEVCKSNDNIPGPLLVLILKLNKESPNRRDVFRAPGHQGAMKKLIHFLQAGRLVNVDNYSVYTIASVLKKFLRKIPQGIFGRSGEQELFAINELAQEAEQTERLHRLLTSLPKYTQHLLVLLFGTFRVIASNAAHAETGMTSEALGVSVAPSFFQSCVSDGKTARMEDVLKFKVATRIMKHIIDKFATHDLFGRENYEYYARVTGRILKVQDEWICSFQYPPPPRGKLAQQKYALQHSLEAEKTWLQCQCERWGLLAQEESRSTPALLTSSSSALDNSVLSLGVTPEHSFIESCARLSVSLEGPGLFALTSSPIQKRVNNDERGDVLDDDIIGGDDDDVADDENDDDDDLIDDDDADNVIDDFAHDLEISHDINDAVNFDLISNSRSYNKRCIRRNNALRAATTCSNNADGDDNDDENNDDKVVEDDDDDDEENTVNVVKRRYRQNKKKSTTSTPTITRVQHQRRLRSNVSKSLDHAQQQQHNENFSPPTPPRVQQQAASNNTKTTTTTATSTPITTTTSNNADNGNATVSATATVSRTLNAAKTRTCSRCNRGIRHSSSCSSASGGGNGGGGSHMTLEELRVVNRYAESTKSLSYLPQVRDEFLLASRISVHERQTARMRTRSEWFLGPDDDDDDDDDDADDYDDVDDVAALKLLQTTCSNCCLRTTYQQHKKQLKQQLQQRHKQQQHISYLGGGSTSNMLQQHHGIAGVDDDGDNNEDDNAASGNMFMLYKKRHKQQLLLQQQQQQQYLLQTTDDYMDTDESNNYERQQQQQQHSIHSTSNSCARRAFLEAGNFLPAATATTTAAATNTVGNIRLSNSAESVQYPVRRTSRRGLGVGQPRQYPLRSSLRRNKEKQVNNSGGGGGGSSNNGGGSKSNSCDSNILNLDIGCSGSNNRPPSVRNSIAECCSNISNNQQYLAMNSNILNSYPFNPVQSRTVSFENRQQLKGFMDDGGLGIKNNSSSTTLTTSTTTAAATKKPSFKSPRV